VVAASVAGPLLAAISFTLVVLVLQADTPVTRWRDVSLLLFVSAGLVFVFHVQAAMWADRYGERAEGLFWEDLGSLLYDVGVMLVIAGVGVLLVPNGPISAIRWITIVITTVALMLEIAWVAYALKLTRRGRGRHGRKWLGLPVRAKTKAGG
jgi:hypothetical protein